MSPCPDRVELLLGSIWLLVHWLTLMLLALLILLWRVSQQTYIGAVKLFVVRLGCCYRLSGDWLPLLVLVCSEILRGYLKSRDGSLSLATCLRGWLLADGFGEGHIKDVWVMYWWIALFRALTLDHDGEVRFRISEHLLEHWIRDLVHNFDTWHLYFADSWS